MGATLPHCAIPNPASLHRANTLAEIETIIAAHVPDDDGLCVGCRNDDEDEAYPCQPVAFALHAADLLARRLAGGGPDRRSAAMEVDLSRASWHRHSRSDDAGSGCVEVAFIGDAVAMRSSDGPDGPIVIYTRQEWDAFIEGVRDGKFAS
jgi:Domain of unknown function (DUF397)